MTVCSQCHPKAATANTSMTMGGSSKVHYSSNNGGGMGMGARGMA